MNARAARVTARALLNRLNSGERIPRGEAIASLEEIVDSLTEPQDTPDEQRRRRDALARDMRQTRRKLRPE